MQTFGGQFESGEFSDTVFLSHRSYNTLADGRFKGTETIQNVPCDQASATCQITVPAPGFAMAFFDSNALAESEPSATVTFSTTAVTRSVRQTTVINPSILATANGQNGGDRAQKGSTSKGSSGAASVYPSMIALVSVLAGSILLLGPLRR